ncbi:MAG: hypothetical protein ABI671_03030 [Burkholderiales bacterium]
MATTSEAAGRLLQESPVNPRTGRVWTLVDEEVRAGVDASKKQMLKTPASALKFLKAEGFVNSDGKLAKKYGGK